MTRSQINAFIADGIEFCDLMNFRLPPFAYWSPENWAGRGHEYDDIRRAKLGWDITDYCMGDFSKIGLLLFTIRNGIPSDPSCPKTYCEKLLIVEENQITPCHYHWSKTEDIICRGGGNLICKVWNATEDDSLADTPVTVNIDGHVYQVPAGFEVRIVPGESITLPSKQYHEFWAEPGTGASLVGEVSKVNDDEHDNNFYPMPGRPPVGRFSAIDEDEPALHWLCNEYPEA
jgi:D-lyxose ketol-isomerase